MGVVDPLEMIDVEESEGKRAFRAKRSRHFARDRLLAGAAVVQTGQLVGQGLPLAVALEVGILGDVGENREQAFSRRKPKGLSGPPNAAPTRPLDVDVLPVVGSLESSQPHP